MSDEHPVSKAFAEQQKERVRVAADLSALSYADVVEARAMVREELYSAVEKRDRLVLLADKLDRDWHALSGEINRRIVAGEHT